MAEAPKSGVFLERRSYRRRRMVDGLRVLPIFAAWLFLLPAFWPQAGERGADITLSSAVIYIFSAWVATIALAGLFLWRLGRSSRRGSGAAAAPGVVSAMARLRQTGEDAGSVRRGGG